ncbi:hypothetical protein GQ55_7G305300 [Panicum hallii var. hallii]|uniref:Uncharacterized protein n=1 Tax=Panicum hallii var. hallii TaxID=1504633 RepID=A0A2T7D0P5_9POAL|nr:hypothetical protein GQ55_7G305300 [Panicum hallii var. hallii]
MPLLSASVCSASFGGKTTHGVGVRRGRARQQRGATPRRAACVSALRLRQRVVAALGAALRRAPMSSRLHRPTLKQLSSLSSFPSSHPPTAMATDAPVGKDTRRGWHKLGDRRFSRRRHGGQRGRETQRWAHRAAGPEHTHSIRSLFSSSPWSTARSPSPASRSTTSRSTESCKEAAAQTTIFA